MGRERKVERPLYFLSLLFSQPAGTQTVVEIQRIWVEERENECVREGDRGGVLWDGSQMAVLYGPRHFVRTIACPMHGLAPNNNFNLYF